MANILPKTVQVTKRNLIPTPDDSQGQTEATELQVRMVRKPKTRRSIFKIKK